MYTYLIIKKLFGFNYLPLIRGDLPELMASPPFFMRKTSLNYIPLNRGKFVDWIKITPNINSLIKLNMSDKQTKVIAFYLPQFHPIKENNEWWGTGFTEWTNVAKAKPLFRGHEQPKTPSELGFYDLRVPEVREAQAKLAKEAGVSAFCYWHYWFGNGKMLLEKPLKAVIETGKPDFPFCLAWANHTWYKKHWNNEISRLSKKVLIEQEYPGEKDIEDHFYAMLPAFKDKRYFKLHEKLVFVIYNVNDLPNIDLFIDKWQFLAKENDLPAFYFIAHVLEKDLDIIKSKKIDAINLHLLRNAFNISKQNSILSLLLKRPLNVIEYSTAMKFWESEIIMNPKIYPSIYPNWDTTPRLGSSGIILKNSNPVAFKKHVGKILDLIKEKEAEDRVIFLKSWNEWAEGNYMEPDLKYGKGFIKALRESLDKKI